MNVEVGFACVVLILTIHLYILFTQKTEIERLKGELKSVKKDLKDVVRYLALSPEDDNDP